ncbi:MAG: LapA family protein [candidate division WOR-3 bacterium]|nr:LapA family protein [candidate division WOR-3 bacterium]
MFIVVGIIVVIFVVFGTLILAQNATQVTLTLLGRTIETNLSLVIIESVVVGIVFAFVIMAISEIRLRRAIRNKERDIKNLKEELAAVRNLPLEEGKVEEEE